MKVAGRVSSTKMAAWSRTSSMNDMRSGRSLESCSPGWEGLLAELVGAEGAPIGDSSEGWAGSSLMCIGRRRTRLPNGAIVGVKDAVVTGCQRTKQRQREVGSRLVSGNNNN